MSPEFTPLSLSPAGLAKIDAVIQREAARYRARRRRVVLRLLAGGFLAAGAAAYLWMARLPAPPPESFSLMAAEGRVPPAEPAEPAATFDYFVARNDNLSSIAQDYFGDAQRIGTLLAANPRLRADAPLPIGLRLQIPDDTGDGRRCRVRKGDTLAGIAKRQRVSEHEVRRLNRLRSDERLKANTWIRLPAAAGGSQFHCGVPM